MIKVLFICHGTMTKGSLKTQQISRFSGINKNI